jgi:EmrB/QacA subfamily drug resistance transporter
MTTDTLQEHVSMQHQPFFRKWGGLIVLSLALAIIIIDTTLLNVSLRAIITDLHTDLKSMQWVITIYSLILAAFTITGGRLGDLFGKKRMFIAGAIIFAIGSFLASISNGIGMMVIGEAIIEGIGAALMMPATASLLITNFEGRDRAIAFGVWGGIAAASSAIGPILGGWLTTNYDWRWGFRINIVVVALVLLGSFLIHENHNLRTKSKIDFVGILLSSLGLLSLVFGFIQASTFGWFKAKEQLIVLNHAIDFGTLSATPVFILLGLIILTIFIFWERAYEQRGKTPLLSLALFKNKQFITGASTMAVLALGQAGLFFTIPVFLQAVRHLDALHTGLTLLPMSLSLLVAAPLSAFLIKFVKPKWLVQTGMMLSAIAFVVLRANLSVDATAWTLAPGFIIFGFGMGLIMAQVSNLTLSAVSGKEAGEASGLNNTLRMVGQTLGSAILGAVLLSALVSNVTNGIKESHVIPDQAKQAMEDSVSSHISDISFGASENTSPDVPQNVRDELAHITNQATVDANKEVMLYGLSFILLGLLVSTQLSSKPLIHSTEEPQTQNKDEFNAPLAAPLAASKPEVIEKPKTSSKRKLKWLNALIIFLLIIAGSIYALKSSDSDQSNSQDQPLYASLGVDPNFEDSVNNEPSSEISSPVEQPQPTINTPTETPSPASASPAATTDYTNKQFHLSMTVPRDWEIKTSDDQLLITTPQSNRYNIQSYTIAGSSMDSLKEFLETQPNIHEITATTFAGLPAYTFAIDGNYERGFAFLRNGRLYYMLGSGIENSAIARTFKAI